MNKALVEIAGKIAVMDRQMKEAIAAYTLGQMKAAGLVEPDAPVFLPLSDSLPVAWRKEADELAQRLEKELPALISIPKLAAYFGVSYRKIRTLVEKGLLEVAHQDNAMAVPREALGVYIARYGAPRSRKLFYGAAGIVEYGRTK